MGNGNPFAVVKAIQGFGLLNLVKSGACSGTAYSDSDQGRSLRTVDSAKWKEEGRAHILPLDRGNRSMSRGSRGQGRVSERECALISFIHGSPSRLECETGKPLLNEI